MTAPFIHNLLPVIHALFGEPFRLVSSTSINNATTYPIINMRKSVILFIVFLMALVAAVVTDNSDTMEQEEITSLLAKK